MVIEVREFFNGNFGVLFEVVMVVDGTLAEATSGGGGTVGLSLVVVIMIAYDGFWWW